MKLTTEEYNVLNHITSVTKTDCWFSLKTDKDGNDYVYDLEENCKMTLQKAVGQLYEATFWMTMNDWEELGIDTQEIIVYTELLKKCEIIY